MHLNLIGTRDVVNSQDVPVRGDVTVFRGRSADAIWASFL